MKVIADSLNISFDESHRLQITITTPNKEAIAETHTLKGLIMKGKKLDIEIKQHRYKRSHDANSMLWVICQKVAEVLQTTKEEIYRLAIKEVGVFEIVPIKAEAVERWVQCWNEKGIGWFAEVMEDSKIDGYKKVINYYGSSVYDTKEMSRLLDHIITDAKEAGIEVMTDSERQLLLQEWGQKAG